MTPKSYNIEDLRCNAFTTQGKAFDMVRYEDFMRETHGFAAPHRHNYYMLFLATSGSGRQLIDFKSFAIRPGMMFFMYPGMIHAWESDEHLRGYLIFFTADFFAQRYHYNSLLSFPFFNNNSKRPFVPLDAGALGSQTKLMELMLSEYEAGGERSESVLRSLLNVVLIQASREYDQQHCFDTEEKKRMTLLKDFEQLVEGHYQQKRLVREYAQLLLISPNYLNVVVKEITGRSAGEMIRERIMLEAKRELTHNGRTVAEISHDLNFKDPSYFCRFFKKYEGLSPDNFRKQFVTRT
ncbi:helix-turn-helix domain-containing protein [Flavilitoribacter nigricans]|uniref:helix-turn-helix domain-containing protein n=1 Tax=Flavilitoribacter nigricans TaxID=70997 RepID=UPI0014767CFB|nr:helix-turn-helix domain-containing protein [Flavilitoribacter nigricans]